MRGRAGGVSLEGAYTAAAVGRPPRRRRLPPVYTRNKESNLTKKIYIKIYFYIFYDIEYLPVAFWLKRMRRYTCRVGALKEPSPKCIPYIRSPFVSQPSTLPTARVRDVPALGERQGQDRAGTGVAGRPEPIGALGSGAPGRGNLVYIFSPSLRAGRELFAEGRASARRALVINALPCRSTAGAHRGRAVPRVARPLI